MVEAVNVVTAQITAASVPVSNNLNMSWVNQPLELYSKLQWYRLELLVAAADGAPTRTMALSIIAFRFVEATLAAL